MVPRKRAGIERQTGTTEGNGEQLSAEWGVRNAE